MMAPAYTMTWTAARKCASRSTKMPARLARVTTMKSRLPTGFLDITTPRALPMAMVAKM